MNKQAKNILFSTYWSAAGWREVPSVSQVDFEYAKSQRAMFDPVSPSHEEAIKLVQKPTKKIDARAVANRFLASLSTRRLEWRSALGSYMAMRWMPEHEAASGERVCRICGLQDYHHVAAHDLNIKNFARLKWGGIDHTDPIYATLDLQLFLEEQDCMPNDEDVKIFKELISNIANASRATTSANLHKLFPSTLKSNKAERDQLIAILGICGILGTSEHPGFSGRFVPRNQRSLPSRHFVDMAYPACWWTGADGINRHYLQEAFGDALENRSVP
ncbi:hypothetical protein GN316_05110 [Xylophilus sp. Kf1]|nr:hypothetical protein [Xylophilus sp. Kf1]